MSRQTSGGGERGIALLSVLLLVAVMAIVTTIVLDRVNLAVRLAGNQQAMDNARFAALAAENLAGDQIRRQLQLSPARTVDTGWLGQPQAVPLGEASGALVTATVRDGGKCFNLNSVVEGKIGDLALRPVGVDQFIGLMQALGVDEREARPVALALADWIDSDDVETPGGAEDGYYLRLEAPYRTAGTLLSDVGELRAVRGMTPALFERLAPWVCTLPETTLSPLNVNTLRPEQAPLLMMLAPSVMTAQRARGLIEARPQLGYARLADFWRPLTRQSLIVGPQIEAQPGLTTRWFEVELIVEMPGGRFRQTSLIDAQKAPAEIIYRRIGEP